MKRELVQRRHGGGERAGLDTWEPGEEVRMCGSGEGSLGGARSLILLRRKVVSQKGKTVFFIVQEIKLE